VNCWSQCYKKLPQKGVAGCHSNHFEKAPQFIFSLWVQRTAHNWSFFTIFKQIFWPLLGYKTSLSKSVSSQFTVVMMLLLSYQPVIWKVSNVSSSSYVVPLHNWLQMLSNAISSSSNCLFFFECTRSNKCKKHTNVTAWHCCRISYHSWIILVTTHPALPLTQYKQNLY